MASESAPHDTVFAATTTLQTAQGLSAEFHKDLTVTGSLLGCHILVNGQLVAGDAEVVGGLLQLSGQATVGTLGDAQATPTRVVIAAAAGPNQKLAAALKVLEEEKVAITTMRGQIALLEDDSSQFDHSQREEMTLAMFDLPDQQAALDRLEQLTQVAHERFGSDEGPKPSLSVSGKIHRGVTIEFADAGTSWTCDEVLPGVCVVGVDADGTVTLTSDDGEVRPAPSTPVAETVAEEKTAAALADEAPALVDNTVYRLPSGE